MRVGVSSSRRRSQTVDWPARKPAEEPLPEERPPTDQAEQPDAVAIAAVMERPWADVVLSGATTVGELVSNLTAPSIELSPDELLELANCMEPADDYWAARSRLAWT